MEEDPANRTDAVCRHEDVMPRRHLFPVYRTKSSRPWSNLEQALGQQVLEALEHRWLSKGKRQRGDTGRRREDRKREDALGEVRWYYC